jgi:hypothetical protein
MEHHPPLTAADPAPSLRSSEEEVVLHLHGFAVLRAIYEAEGYYDEGADGDPEEQDLYCIEVLDALRATDAAEALEGEAVWPLVALGLTDVTVRRLFPAARWSPERDALTLARQYLLALAHALLDATSPAGRQRALEESVGWSPAVILDRAEALPLAWRRLLPR